MTTATQSIREIVSTQPSAAAVLERFAIDLCSQADAPLDAACTELQLSIDQVLEKLSDAARNEQGATPEDLSEFTQSRLIQHIVRVHHQCVRQELPRLVEMTRKLAGNRADCAPELKSVERLLHELRADLFNHIQKEEMVLFPFIAQMEEELLQDGAPAHACFRTVAQPISMMMQEHDTAGLMMAELRRLTQEFVPPQWACATHAAFFAGLRAFEADLAQHVHLENDVLFPTAIRMEAELNQRG